MHCVLRTPKLTLVGGRDLLFRLTQLKEAMKSSYARPETVVTTKSTMGTEWGSEKTTWR